MTDRTCSIEDCEERHYALGWCNYHWQGARRYGDPLGKQTKAPVKCSILTCSDSAVSRGWCKPHYMSWYHHGDPLWVAPSPRLICSIPGCEEPHRVRTWCSAHYQKWVKYGDPLGRAPEVAPRGCNFPGCPRAHRAHGYCATHWNHTKRGLPLLPLEEGERRKKYSLDHHYFDEITDERRAYWLGFITADGCLTENEGRQRLVIELAERDADHLKTLCVDLGSDRPLQFARGCAKASFPSKHIFKALGQLGVHPRKSKTVSPWSGPVHLMPHYWRGLVDGDGTVSRATRSGKWTVGLVGSEACVSGFAEWARAECESAAVHRLVTHGGCWSWTVTGTHKPQALARSLYAGSHIALERKMQRAEQLVEITFPGVPRAR